MTEKTRVPENGIPPAKRRRNALVTAFALAALLAVGLVAWQIISPQEPETTKPETSPAAAMTVSDASMRLVDWPVQLDASGVIAPWQEATIGGQVSGGQLIELLVEPGDAVRKGQVLARFDTEALRIEVAQLRATVRQARAEAAQALTNRDRALKLKGSGSMSEQDVLQAMTLSETASAQAVASQAQLASRELQLNRATVISPDDGVISARNATIGSVGAVGDELFRLIRQNRLEWRGELTASQLRQVELGQPITLELPDGSTANATVRQLASSLDSQTRLGIVYADIMPGSTARSGMYAQGRVVVTHRQASVVPASSVVIRDGRSHVFKLDMQGDVSRATLQLVEIGRRYASDVEIIHGLVDGARVAVQGAGFLNDGDTVRVVKAPDVVAPSGSSPQ